PAMYHPTPHAQRRLESAQKPRESVVRLCRWLTRLSHRARSCWKYSRQFSLLACVFGTLGRHGRSTNIVCFSGLATDPSEKQDEPSKWERGSFDLLMPETLFGVVQAQALGCQ